MYCGRQEIALPSTTALTFARYHQGEEKKEITTSVSLAGNYPGSEKISVKLLANKQTQRILGGQIVGFKGTARRMDTLLQVLI